MLRLACALSIAMLASCTPPFTNNTLPGVKDRSSLRITLARNACYGSCPMYLVEIHGDGTATYCGIHFVKEVGERTRRITDADLSRLVEQFHAAKFFELNDEYIAPVMDNPTYEIAIAFDGKSKAVLDSVGERAGMPVAVTALEEAVDAVAQVSEWVGEGGGSYANEWPECATRFGFQPPQIVIPVPL